jgi:hypothetical protein
MLKVVVLGAKHQEPIGANFHGAAVLFNRELFKLEFRHEKLFFSIKRVNNSTTKAAHKYISEIGHDYFFIFSFKEIQSLNKDFDAVFKYLLCTKT